MPYGACKNTKTQHNKIVTVIKPPPIDTKTAKQNPPETAKAEGREKRKLCRVTKLVVFVFGSETQNELYKRSFS